jgi:ADP-L-glycero-D-manno-heptose 6-epimerase
MMREGGKMIIVTGGAGFIGSNLLAALEQQAIGPLVVVDWLGQGEKWRNIAKRELYDVITPEALWPFLEREQRFIEAIIHLGAISATTQNDVDLILNSNIRLSLDLWRWCCGHQIRFIYASSAATYGNGEAGFIDQDSPQALSALRPLNAYGWSKHMVDRAIIRHCQQGLLTPPQWAGLKFFNVYGPNEYHKGRMASVIHHLVPKLRAGEPARLFKSYHPNFPDGGQCRDFVWVEDCCAVILWLLENPSVTGIFNVGTGQACSFAALARACFHALALPERIEYIEMPEDIRDKYQYFTQASQQKLQAQGYMRPITDLQQGVSQYVQEYLLKPDPYR